MKSMLKTLVAASVIAATGSAQAAILNGSAAYGANKDGELFISIFREDPALAPTSMVLDTGIDIGQLKDGVLRGWTSSAAQTAAINSFLSTSTLDNFVFNAGGASSASFVNPFGATPEEIAAANDFFRVYLTTSDPIDINNGPFGASGLTTTQKNIVDYTTAINQVYGDIEFQSGIADGEAGYHGQTNLWDDDSGATTDFNTEGTIGTALELVSYFNASPDNFEKGFESVGFFNIDGATGEATLTTVPVPAAVWLFGSGLVGMVGVARRRKA